MLGQDRLHVLVEGQFGRQRRSRPGGGRPRQLHRTATDGDGGRDHSAAHEHEQRNTGKRKHHENSIPVRTVRADSDNSVYRNRPVQGFTAPRALPAGHATTAADEAASGRRERPARDQWPNNAIHSDDWGWGSFLATANAGRQSAAHHAFFRENMRRPRRGEQPNFASDHHPRPQRLFVNFVPRISLPLAESGDAPRRGPIRSGR